VSVDVNDFIGSGIALTDIYSGSKKCLKYVTGVEKINQSILFILRTRVRECMSNPLFGSRLHEVVFDGNDMITADMIDMFTRDALIKWEPRIAVLSVDIDFEGAIYSTEYSDTLSVPVKINYMIKNNDLVTSFSLVMDVGVAG
jgi:phage baseplate assembly protein W